MTQCDCYIELEDGYGDDGRHIRSSIVYCQLHDAAPELRAALERIAHVTNDPAAHDVAGLWRVICEAHAFAVDALRTAERGGLT